MNYDDSDTVSNSFSDDWFYIRKYITQYGSSSGFELDKQSIEKINPRSKKSRRDDQFSKLLKVRPINDKDKELMSDKHDKDKSVDRY